MKLFVRSLLLFLSVILIQYFLTYILITNVINSVNETDARESLESETAAVSASFAEAKRKMWYGLVRMKRSEQLKNFLDERSAELLGGDFRSMLKELLPADAADWIAFSRTEMGSGGIPGGEMSIPIQLITLDVTMIPPEPFGYEDLYETWPMLRLDTEDGGNFLQGTLRVAVSASVFWDINIVRRLDREFFFSCATTPATQVLFYRNGSLNGSSSFQAEEMGEELPPFSSSPLDYLYSETVGAERWNLSYKRIDGNHYIVTALSNTPYEQRIGLVVSNLIWVSAISVLVAIILGLVFSRHITLPVRKMIGALHEVQAGNFDASLKPASIYEFGELVRGFNSMAAVLKQDRTEMDRYVSEITELKEYNETIVDSIGSAILIVGHENVVEGVNREFLENFSFPEDSVRGRPVEDILPDLFDPSIVKKLVGVRHGDIGGVSEKLVGRGKQIYEVKIYPLQKRTPGRERQAVVVIDDISKERELEEKIFLAEKLSSISMLSAGVAHEMNNPLASILSNTQLLLDGEEDADRQESLRWIEQETLRIRRIIRQLLDFASEQKEHEYYASCKGVIENTVQLLSLSERRRGTIDIIVDIPEGIPRIAISPDELKQVTLNIVKNSLQALNGRGGIHIAAEVLDGSDGKKIRLSYRDDGPGIEKEIIPRIFDPFFTTKQNGIGTGLGLSVVYGIITKYGGTVEVRSENVCGTEFLITLPAQRDDNGF